MNKCHKSRLFNRPSLKSNLNMVYWRKSSKMQLKARAMTDQLKASSSRRSLHKWWTMIGFGAITYTDKSKCLSPFKADIEEVHWRKINQMQLKSRVMIDQLKVSGSHWRSSNSCQWKQKKWMIMPICLSDLQIWYV